MIKKIIYTFIILFYILTSKTSAQIIGFYPEVDTLFIAGGCTPPEINVTISESPTFVDTIKITPGWNTYLWKDIPDGNDQYFEQAFFLVLDSLDILDYELWIEHDQPSFAVPVSVPFDSNFIFDARQFVFKLIAYQNGVSIYSLSQNFIAKIGIGVSGKKNQYYPDQFKISQNYPNPFNLETTIKYSIPFASEIKISVFNISGQLIKTLLSQYHRPGIYSITWNAKQMNSGMYIIQLKNKRYSLMRKCSLLK